MTAMDSCAQKGTATGATKCYAAVKEMKSKEALVAKYWKNMTSVTKYTASPKSKEVRDSKNAEATWILKGVNEGLHKIFPDRFDKYGDRIKKCHTAAGDVAYGTKCENAIGVYVTAVGPSAFKTKKEADAKRECFTSNDAGLAPLTGAKCELR